MRPSLPSVLESLAMPTAPESWQSVWPSVQARYPAVGPEWLTPAGFDTLLTQSGFPAEIAAPLRAARAQIARKAALRRLAWLWHVLFFEEGQAGATMSWPTPVRTRFDEAVDWPQPAEAPLFLAVVLLSGLPALRAAHAARGIPEAVTRDTVSDIAVWMRHSRRWTGTWAFSRINWLRHHFSGRLHRLGRLQCLFMPNSLPLYAYRDQETGRVLALSAAGVRFRRDGLVDGTNGVDDPQAWVSTFEETSDAACGTPIDPRGKALAPPVSLPLARWTPVLRPGDPVLDLHIAADGPMDFDQCGASLRQALTFYPHHFPELPTAQAFTCNSWLLDAQYQALLAPESNIVRFQQEFYLAPIRSDEDEPFFRVFNGKPADLHAASRATALERAILDTTLAGVPLHCAIGFILTEGLCWGSKRYQAAAY